MGAYHLGRETRRQLILTILVLALLFAAGFANLYCLRRTVGRVDALVEAAAASEMPTQARAHFEQAQRAWEASQTYLASVVLHDGLDEIEFEFASAAHALENGQDEDFLAHARRLRTQLDMLIQDELPSVANIF